MSRLGSLWRRSARFFGIDVVAEVNEELAFHLEEKTRALIASGLDPDAARREALRQFGAVGEVRRECQDWGRVHVRSSARREWRAGWRQDARDALRSLRSAPMLSLVAVASIALGIGANTAIFTLLDQVLLRALPVSAPEQLVRVATSGFFYGSTSGTGQELSYPLYTDIRDGNDVFSNVLGTVAFTAPVNIGGAADLVQGELVSGTYFSTLGVGMARGRAISRTDDVTAGAHPVVVVSHRFWRSRFAGDPDVLGREIRISNRPFTVIGVAAEGFEGMNVTAAAQVFVPLAMDGVVSPQLDRLTARGSRWLHVFARLAPGITPERAAASLSPIYRAIRTAEVGQPHYADATAATRQRYIDENDIVVAAAPQGLSPRTGRLARALVLLMALACGVLLISCANVANLLLARAASRQREVALRIAVGATRGRIVRQLLVESLVLGCAGGALGVLLAIRGAEAMLPFLADSTQVSLLRATPDLRVLLFTLGVTMATGLLFGIVPALLATRPALAPTLRGQAINVIGGGHTRVRWWLTVSQVALSLLLLTGAGLFVRSLQHLMTTDLGYRPESLVTFGVDPTQAGYSRPRTRQYARDLLASVRATPGVLAAGYTSVGLLWGGAWGSSIAVEGYARRDDEHIGSRCNAVSPGYFAAMGIPLLLGRDFDERDVRTDESTAPEVLADEGYRVAIASESFARAYLGESPLGRHIGFGSEPGTPTRIRIVGVVKDSTYTSPGERRQWQLYFPYQEAVDPRSAWFYVRTAQDPATMLGAMRDVIRQIDPAVPAVQLRTMHEQLAKSVTDQRFIATLATAFGVLATMLAAVGLFGVMTHTVTRRTAEIGLRVALGARAARVLGLVMREALGMVGTGIALAVPAGYVLSRYVRSELHGIGVLDPLAIGGAVVCLIVVAILATFMPARRASRLDPLQALRRE